MEKIKRFVILPLGLLIINLVLAFYRNPWRSLFNYQLDFWQKTGYFLRGLSGCAAYIFLIALLFTFVFTRVRVSELFKKPALKTMGIVLAAELAARLLTEIIMQLTNRSVLEAVKHGTEMTWWYSVYMSLPGLLIRIAVLYFTLRLLLKPLNLDFTLRKLALFNTVFIYVSVDLLSLFLMMRLIEYLNKTGDFPMASINLLGMAVSMDMSSALFTVVPTLVVVFLDLLIFEYFRRCIKDNGETAPTLNPINN
jgi:hypothetical protein